MIKISVCIRVCLYSIWQPMYSKLDRFVIPFDVTFAWTKFPQNMTLVQYLVQCCQTRIGEWLTFRTKVQSSIIQYNWVQLNTTNSEQEASCILMSHRGSFEYHLDVLELEHLNFVFTIFWKSFLRLDLPLLSLDQGMIPFCFSFNLFKIAVFVLL